MRKKTAIPKIFILATKGIVFKDKKRRTKHVYMKTRVNASIIICLFIYLTDSRWSETVSRVFW